MEHNYKIILKDGRSIIIEDYQIVKRYWYEFKEQLELVEIVDK